MSAIAPRCQVLSAPKSKSFVKSRPDNRMYDGKSRTLSQSGCRPSPPQKDPRPDEHVKQFAPPDGRETKIPLMNADLSEDCLSPAGIRASAPDVIVQSNPGDPGALEAASPRDKESRATAAGETANTILSAPAPKQDGDGSSRMVSPAWLDDVSSSSDSESESGDGVGTGFTDVLSTWISNSSATLGAFVPPPAPTKGDCGETAIMARAEGEGEGKSSETVSATPDLTTPATSDLGVDPATQSAGSDARRLLALGTQRSGQDSHLLTTEVVSEPRKTAVPASWKALPAYDGIDGCVSTTNAKLDSAGTAINDRSVSSHGLSESASLSMDDQPQQNAKGSSNAVTILKRPVVAAWGGSRLFADIVKGKDEVSAEDLDRTSSQDPAVDQQAGSGISTTPDPKGSASKPGTCDDEIKVCSCDENYAAYLSGLLPTI